MAARSSEDAELIAAMESEHMEVREIVDQVRTVADELDALVDAARHIGITLEAPFMQLSFLGLSVIPQLRITDKGLVDVDRFELTDTFS